MVRFGTKWPSMTSTCSQSAVAATSPTASARAPKSAESSDGATLSAPTTPGSTATGPAYGATTAPVTPAPAASEPGPAQDAGEGVEVGRPRPEGRRQAPAVAV